MSSAASTVGCSPGWTESSPPLGHGEIPAGARHARHLYPVVLDVDRLGTSRDDFVRAMRKQNIRVSFHYPVLHLTTVYHQLLGLSAGAFPIAERLNERLVSLPLSNGLSTQDVRYVVQAIERLRRESLDNW